MPKHEYDYTELFSFRGSVSPIMAMVVHSSLPSFSLPSLQQARLRLLLCGDMSNANRIGQNIVLSSVLAVFSYVPFEYVAKTTLLVSSVLFILDPIPPVTRLLSIIAAAIVLILSRIERHWREHHQASIEEEEQEEEDKSKDD